MAIQRSDDRGEAGSVFRTSMTLYWAFLGMTLIMTTICVVFVTTDVWEPKYSAEEDRTFGLLVTAMLVIAAVGSLVALPFVRRRTLGRRVESTTGLSVPLVQLQTATVLSLAFAESVATYGLVSALLWRADIGLLFCAVGAIAVVFQRPRWSAWQRHIARSAQR